MPISLEQLKTDMTNAAETADALGLEYERLTDAELEKFGMSFERQFVLNEKYREVVDILNRHRAEILMGCMVATKQFSKRFDGERPEAGKFGMVDPRAGFFGIGDDWEDNPSVTGGALANWIHSGTTRMGGTSGNAAKIGKNAVHVIVAIGDYELDPKMEAIQFTIDGKPKPVTIVKRAMHESDYGVKELDVAFIFKYGTTVLAKIFQKTTGTSYPYLIGASFVPENILREYADPVNLSASAGVTADVILTT